MAGSWQATAVDIVDSPGCIAGTLGRRDVLPVAQESPPCVASVSKE